MLIKKINLINYRNIENIKFYPSEKCTVLYGNNAQGKTNILESIYLLSYFKSFRQSRNIDLIGKKYDFCNITAYLENKSVNYKYNLNINSKQKIIKINDNIPDDSHYLDFIKSVIYSTDELLLFRGSNLLRKNFIDRCLFLVDKNYLQLVKKYNFIVKSRNVLLKKNLTDELQLWTQLLAETGSLIRKKRSEYIVDCNIDFNIIYNAIFNKKDVVYIKYDDFTKPYDVLVNDFISVLAYKKQSEIHNGQTLYGPHLDKIDFYINDKNLKYYGSQGQLRAILLAFRLTQLYSYKEKFDKFPIFLMDDICSELDSKKIDALFEYIQGNIGQIFITTTNKKNLNVGNMKNICFFKVKSGAITAD